MAILRSGDRVLLERATKQAQARGVKQEWVCWLCEESVEADGPEFSNADVTKFMKDHGKCNRGPYHGWPVGE